MESRGGGGCRPEGEEEEEEKDAEQKFEPLIGKNSITEPNRPAVFS